MIGPRADSRFAFSYAEEDEGGRFVLSDYEPFRFRELPDSRTHVVVAGDTLFHLAGRYFAPLERACGYWWVIADFQPEAIVDPTLELELGRVLVIPSVRVLANVILSDARHREVA